MPETQTETYDSDKIRQVLDLGAVPDDVIEIDGETVKVKPNPDGGFAYFRLRLEELADAGKVKFSVKERVFHITGLPRLIDSLGDEDVAEA